MRQALFNRKYSVLDRPFLKPSLLILILSFTITGCTSMTDLGASVKAPTQPATDISQLFKNTLTQCPSADPANTICTAQYEPVCVKTEVGSVISYRTASNACSACNIPEAVGYVKGECR